MSQQLPISRSDAWQLLNSMEQSASDLNHYLESEVIMRALAKRFGQDEDYWGMLGLLHDVDWSVTKDSGSEHCIKAAEILKSNGFSDEFIETIQSHGYGWQQIPSLQDKKRTKTIVHALAAAETVTGLIYAYALMRGRNISEMEVAGLKKRFKDKRFAANCNREIIRECEKINLSLEEFFELSIQAMRSIKEEIGLV
jgi:putative nucleotidyltransferase with HDIG domain